MIPYDELVSALANWRARQGLPAGPSDYLGGPPPYQVAAAIAESQGVTEIGADLLIEEDQDGVVAMDEQVFDAGQMTFEETQAEQPAPPAPGVGYVDEDLQAQLDPQAAYPDPQAAYPDPAQYAPAHHEQQDAYAQAADGYEYAEQGYEAPPPDEHGLGGYADVDEATMIGENPMQAVPAPVPAPGEQPGEYAIDAGDVVESIGDDIEVGDADSFDVQVLEDDGDDEGAMIDDAAVLDEQTVAAEGALPPPPPPGAPPAFEETAIGFDEYDASVQDGDFESDDATHVAPDHGDPERR